MKRHEPLVDVAATARLCRLAQDDKITQPARDALVGLTDSRSRVVRRFAAWALYLVGCPWCMAVWCSAAVMTLRGLDRPVASLTVRGLAVAEFAGRYRHTEKDLQKWWRQQRGAT